MTRNCRKVFAKAHNWITFYEQLAHKFVILTPGRKQYMDSATQRANLVAACSPPLLIDLKSESCSKLKRAKVNGKESN